MKCSIFIVNRNIPTYMHFINILDITFCVLEIPYLEALLRLSPTVPGKAPRGTIMEQVFSNKTPRISLSQAVSS